MASPSPGALPFAEPGGSPLTWADVVPGWSNAIPGWPDDATGWPDDVSLPDLPAPEPEPEPMPRPDNLAYHAPWAAADTPLSPQPSPFYHADRATRPSAAPPPPSAVYYPDPLAASPSLPEPPAHPDGEPPFGPRPQPAVPRSQRAFGFDPEAFPDPEALPDPDAFADSDDAPAPSPAAEASQPRTAAGVFSSDLRSRLPLLDPGRRGARALVVVALAVVLIAAFLTWRSRPSVETVEPPAIVLSAEPGTRASVGGGLGASGVPEIVVAVGGKVRKPGLVRLAPGSRVADALTAAGGADPGVDVAALNLARKVTDGELIMVGVTPPPAPAPTAPAGSPGAAQPGQLVNLNTATLADLDTLPGVGPVLAQRILDARAAQGGFTAVSDLQKVDGIGTARYEELKDLVTV